MSAGTRETRVLSVHNSPLNSLWLSSTRREFDSLKERPQIESSASLVVNKLTMINLDFCPDDR